MEITRRRRSSEQHVKLFSYFDLFTNGKQVLVPLADLRRCVSACALNK